MRGGGCLPVPRTLAARYSIFIDLLQLKRILVLTLRMTSLTLLSEAGTVKGEGGREGIMQMSMQEEERGVYLRGAGGSGMIRRFTCDHTLA